ncbi:MAG: M48 family metalloprotease [Acidobacteria bacterium]|nr:M48 family metalloprotease [Acidobacteriota bacterium]
MLTKILTALALCSSVCCAAARAQDCAPPPVVANAKSPNLFSPEQEMIFGDLAIQNMAGELRFIRDEKLLAYVRGIGDRLAKHLPPTGLKFQFHLIELPEANAFNLPGGHILVSRKLVALSNNEDELASVIAHEFGHAVVRHGATDISEALRKLLKVTALGDRKDVVEKYNLLIERARTKSLGQRRGHEDAQQQEADRVGLFAMVAAGYDAAAFAAFFNRLTESEGKTGGGWFSDLFGNVPPEQKRLREMIRATEKLPAACREGRAARATEDFLKWQADVVSFRPSGRKEDLPGLLWKRDLAPKLRSDIAHFAFSPDGKFLLAQDDFAVTVLERAPLRVLFQIPVEDANEAAFTPDGQFVVLTTENLRYEKWSVAEGRPAEVRELVLKNNCWEHKLSPDGRYLACVDISTTINVLDTKTGKKIWEKEEFYPLSYFEIIAWLQAGESDSRRLNFFRIEFSPDARFVMFSRSNRFRFRFSINLVTADQSENTALALDLTTLKPTGVGGELKKLASRPYLFLDSERILGTSAKKGEDGGIFSFPAGKRLQKFPLGAQEMKRTANPDYVIIKPLAEAKLGFFDLRKGAVASGMNKPDATIWGDLTLYEGVSGKILLREVSYNEAEKKFDGKDAGSIEIPVSALKSLNAAAVSDSLDWMLLSSKTRGGLWHLGTGERKLYLRGLKGGVVADDGLGVGDFPKYDDAPHSLVLLNPHTNVVAPFVADKIIWSRDFPKEAPEFSFDKFSGRLIFFWKLGGDAGKARLKESAELKSKADALGNKADDYLVEIVDAFAQKTVGTLLLETGQGSFDVGGGLSEGDWLVLHDSEGRVLVYSIKDGDLRHRFFGSDAAINQRRNLLAVENFPGEVALYDLDTGDRRAAFVFRGGAAFVRFNLAGDKLFVLSDLQTAYAFNLNTVAAKPPAR